MGADPSQLNDHRGVGELKRMDKGCIGLRRGHLGPGTLITIEPASISNVEASCSVICTVNERPSMMLVETGCPFPSPSTSLGVRRRRISESVSRIFILYLPSEVLIVLWCVDVRERMWVRVDVFNRFDLIDETKHSKLISGESILDQRSQSGSVGRTQRLDRVVVSCNSCPIDST